MAGTWFVIADDATGACATAALLAEQGRIVEARFRTPDAWPAGTDALALSLESRRVSPAEARARAAAAAAWACARGAAHVAKRIDSTLRGNLGAEIEGVLAVLDGAAALVVPAFPRSERIALGGHVMWRGRPAADAAAVEDDTGSPAADVTPGRLGPASPGRSTRRRPPPGPDLGSHVPTLLARQTALPIVHVPLAAVEADEHRTTAAALGRARKGGARIVVADAVTDAHLTRLAAAASEAGGPWVAVDPGPFTAACAAQGHPAGYAHVETAAAAAVPDGGFVLAVIGSRSRITCVQIGGLEHAGAVIATVALGALAGSNHGTREAVIRGSAESVACGPLAGSNHGTRETGIRGSAHFLGAGGASALAAAREAAVAGATLVLRSDPGVAAPSPEIYAGALARAGRAVTEHARAPLAGLYASGGETLRAVCEAFGARALRVLGEVEPLVAREMLVGGPWEGLRVISKGGLVGDATTAVRCVERLRDPRW